MEETGRPWVDGQSLVDERLRDAGRTLAIPEVFFMDGGP
jgi:hypothetical protein